MKLFDLTVRDFLSDLGSDSPAPGGGTVAALCGALGASLVAMGGRLSAGRPVAPGTGEQADVWAKMETAVREGDELSKRFLSLMEEDTEAFNAYMQALKLPKGTDDEKAARRAAMQEAMKGAARVPLEPLRLCERVVALSHDVAAMGNKNALSDAGVAALAANAAAVGAAYNVRINLLSIADANFCARMRSDALAVLERVEKRARDVRDVVERSFA